MPASSSSIYVVFNFFFFGQWQFIFQMFIFLFAVEEGFEYFCNGKSLLSFFKCFVWQGLNSFNQENSLSVHCIKWMHALLSKNCIFSFLICSFKKSDLKNSFIRITWESKYKKTHICFTKIANLQLFEKTTTQNF